MDPRSALRPAEDSGTAAPARAPEPPGEVLADLQTLLGSAVKRLVEATGCAVAAAWALRPSGEPFVVAASMEGVAPLAPPAGLFDALAALGGASDLGAIALPPELRADAAEHGFGAAAPIGPPGEPAVAVLLAGGPADPAGAVRPRTLAALDAAARRLASPAAAAAALGRLGQIDEEVRRLDRLASLGELVAEVVHEVRNPLVSIKTFLQLLPQRIDDRDFRTRFFDVVTGELRRLERLLDGVLEHARPRGAAPATGAAAVAPVLDAVARLLTHRALERGVEISAEAPLDLPHVRLSEDRLRQVTLNLAMNAIEATPSGGKVRLCASEIVRGVEIAVEDEGAGIPPELRARIFEPFFSTRVEKPGGLGLTISRRIVEEHGGSLFLEDRPAGGLVFRVRLARAD